MDQSLDRNQALIWIALYDDHKLKQEILSYKQKTNPSAQDILWLSMLEEQLLDRRLWRSVQV